MGTHRWLRLALLGLAFSGPAWAGHAEEESADPFVTTDAIAPAAPLVFAPYVKSRALIRSTAVKYVDPPAMLTGSSTKRDAQPYRSPWTSLDKAEAVVLTAHNDSFADGGGKGAGASASNNDSLRGIAKGGALLEKVRDESSFSNTNFKVGRHVAGGADTDTWLSGALTFVPTPTTVAESGGASVGKIVSQVPTPTPTATPRPTDLGSLSDGAFQYSSTRANDGRMTPISGGAASPGTWCGHGAPTSQAREYDIWSDNCHTAANAFLLCPNPSGSQRGVLVCGGEPRSAVGHHTANYELRGDQACIMNWHNQCCFDYRGSPDGLLGNTQGVGCARQACGDQYGEGTRVLPPGQMVEMPGPSACARETLNNRRDRLGVGDDANWDDPNNLPRCNSCCDERAGIWSQSEWGQGKHDQFLNTCKSLCNGYFGSRR